MIRSNKNFKPKLLISDYCDSIIREIDIEIEKRLEKCPDEQDKCAELNQDREEMIGEVKKVENEIFEYYERIRKDDETIKEPLRPECFGEQTVCQQVDFVYYKFSWFNTPPIWIAHFRFLS